MQSGAERFRFQPDRAIPSGGIRCGGSETRRSHHGFEKKICRVTGRRVGRTLGEVAGGAGARGAESEVQPPAPKQAQPVPEAPKSAEASTMTVSEKKTSEPPPTVLPPFAVPFPSLRRYGKPRERPNRCSRVTLAEAESCTRRFRGGSRKRRAPWDSHPNGRSPSAHRTRPRTLWSRHGDFSVAVEIALMPPRRSMNSRT